MHNEVSKKNKPPSPTLLFILYIEWRLVFLKKNIQCYTREITPVSIIVFHDTDLFNKLLVCVKNYF